MGLFKLAVYAAVGYVAYQIYQDTVVRAAEQQRQPSAPQAPRPKPRAVTSRTVEPAPALTGPGQGVNVSTVEPGGASMSHRVGRGVVRRGNS